MINLLLPPSWFFAPDVIIDIFSFFVLLSFTIISLKYYKISNNKSILYLGISFLLITLGEFFEIILNVKLYYDLVNTFHLGNIIVVSQVTKPFALFNSAISFFYGLFLLSGFYFMYYSLRDSRSKSDNFITIFFIILITILTQNAHYFFHLTLTVFVSFILLNYWRAYKKTHSFNSKILFIAFLILLISYFVMIFIMINSFVYVIANFMQLVAFVLLLYLIVRIYKHDKPRKKKQD